MNKTKTKTKTKKKSEPTTGMNNSSKENRNG